MDHFQGSIGKKASLDFHKVNNQGFALIHILVAFPILAGIVGAAGAGSITLSRFRTSLGTCRTGLLDAMAPLERVTLRLQKMNPQALLFAKKEIGIRARLAACGAVPITCVEPTAQLARLMIQMKKFNHTRESLKEQAVLIARQHQLNLEQDLRIQGNDLIQAPSLAKLTFDFFPAFVTTPAWVMGPQFEQRTTIRQTFLFHALKHVPSWLVGLLGPSFRWNTFNAQCAATLKHASGRAYRSLSGARHSWSSAL